MLKIESAPMVLANLIRRLLRRIREIPTRGLPRPGRRDRFDTRYGTDTSGVVWLTCPSSTHFASGIRYEPCEESLCEWSITNADVSLEEFTFIDIGCGKGRPLIVASRYGFKHLLGVDYSRKLTRIAEKNLRRCGIKCAQIECADATKFDYPAGNIFAFFYHPFADPALLDSVLNRLDMATRGHCLVVAYVGKGRYEVGRHEWLTLHRSSSDAMLFRRLSTRVPETAART
jgi:SAM-dependent methyltransferase